MRGAVDIVSWAMAASFFAVIVWATLGEEYERRRKN